MSASGSFPFLVASGSDSRFELPCISGKSGFDPSVEGLGTFCSGTERDTSDRTLFDNILSLTFKLWLELFSFSVGMSPIAFEECDSQDEMFSCMTCNLASNSAANSKSSLSTAISIFRSISAMVSVWNTAPSSSDPSEDRLATFSPLLSSDAFVLSKKLLFVLISLQMLFPEQLPESSESASISSNLRFMPSPMSLALFSRTLISASTNFSAHSVSDPFSILF
mmetsp:Transcript_6759/g.10156  ORF Transcript_6759/g.10156 Transcript_6759/m.10156 type:complete len:223 (+) Transcript_6759:613-1281(+)